MSYNNNPRTFTFQIYISYRPLITNLKAKLYVWSLKFILGLKLGMIFGKRICGY